MPSAVSPVVPADFGKSAGFRHNLLRLLRAGMEALVLVLAFLSPWAFGAVEPIFEFLLYAGLALLLGLWGTRMLLEWQFSWKKCPVALCLAGLFLLGVWQVTPLPKHWLGWLSPATVRMYDRLLPAQAEVLPFGEKRQVAFPPAGSTISFCPGVTRQEMLRLLAVFLLFAIVRNNIASAASLRRLSIAVLANGVLLALFGLIQFFTSPHNTVYWNFPSQGQVFGPFINRNHFAFYINLCVGLGIGLLLSSRYARSGGAREALDRAPVDVSSGSPQASATAGSNHRGRPSRDPSRWDDHENRRWLGSPLGLLQDPQAWWTSIALALLLGSVAFCLSRGGLLALLGSSIVCLLIKLWRVPRFSRLGTALLIASAGLALVTWFGLDRVEARWATFWKGEAFQDGRIRTWSRVLPAVMDFPLWGTGYGTFQYVELLHRDTTADLGFLYDHAHNDYLEALVEGGLVGLVLSVLAVGLVFRLGYRAFCRYQDDSAGALALGSLFALTALVIHSFVDFGLHIPAIALLATVVCAHLCALGSPEERALQNIAPPPSTSPLPQTPWGGEGDAGEYSFRLWGLAPLAGMASAVALGLVLVSASWTAARVHHWLWVPALRLGSTSEPDNRERQIAYLESAARRAPDYPLVRVVLGRAHAEAFAAGRQKLAASGQVSEAVQAVLSAAPIGSAEWVVPVTLLGVPCGIAASAARRQLVTEKEQQLARRHLLPALRHYLQARDLCPLMGEPHLRLAANAYRLDRAEPPHAYLERAKFLTPFDAELWYLCGVQAVFEEQWNQAWKDWHRSLELSDRYLVPILDASAKVLDPREVLNQVVPDRPALVLAAASRLYPNPEATAERQPFLEKALALLEKQPARLKAEELHVKALLHWSAGQGAKALAAYQAALAQDPHQVGWRYEFARLLHQEKRLRDARRVLRTVLQQQPGHTQARELLKVIERQIAESM